jgi:hypothetical protein
MASKHKLGPQGGDPAAPPAKTLRHQGVISNADLYGNDPEQLGTELSFMVLGGQWRMPILGQACTWIRHIFFSRDTF